MFLCRGIVPQVFGDSVHLSQDLHLCVCAKLILSDDTKRWPHFPLTPCRLMTSFSFRQMMSIHQAFMHTILKWISIALTWSPGWALPEMILLCLFPWPVSRQVLPFDRSRDPVSTVCSFRLTWLDSKTLHLCLEGLKYFPLTSSCHYCARRHFHDLVHYPSFQQTRFPCRVNGLLSSLNLGSDCEGQSFSPYTLASQWENCAEPGLAVRLPFPLNTIKELFFSYLFFFFSFHLR